MEEDLILCIIADNGDYLYDNNVGRILLQLTPKESRILTKICERNKKYIEFSINFSEPKQGGMNNEI